uniref:Uncharacterized protein n=1 Tax=Schistosoma curassoni TaxID=6186 RepID=A0A183JQ38_9TREM
MFSKTHWFDMFHINTCNNFIFYTKIFNRQLIPRTYLHGIIRR